ncbi:hypothetical protein BDZ91DRAFT_779596 [Kalaharituber pfeilii]|nr:hypothetical protein BDZ91DRAFT_779596 [Kalaharituber pfeilii]
MQETTDGKSATASQPNTLSHCPSTSNHPKLKIVIPSDKEIAEYNASEAHIYNNIRARLARRQAAADKQAVAASQFLHSPERRKQGTPLLPAEEELPQWVYVYRLEESDAIMLPIPKQYNVERSLMRSGEDILRTWGQAGPLTGGEEENSKGKGNGN